MNSLIEFAPYIIPLILAITLHEAAHGYVAYKLGDMTAKRMGRVTFNPLRHIDPNGTILIPGLLILSGSPALFGYAKPVPVNFLALRGANKGQIAVAIAGPATNFLLAFISALLLHLDKLITPERAPFLFQSLYISVMINVVIAVFNMLPLLPLDGGRILNALLPPKYAAIHARSERFGLIIVALLFLLPPLLAAQKIVNIPISYYLLAVPADALRDVIFFLAGIGGS